MRALLPFSYATRHLVRDVPRFLQKILGASVVVLLVFAAGAFNKGMDSLLSSSGSEKNILLLSSGSEESIERSEVDILVESLASTGIRGIQVDLGQSAVSGEVHFMGALQIMDPALNSHQVFLRGMTAAAFQVHQGVRILEGHAPKSGEVLVGVLANQTLGVSKASIGIGKKIVFEGATFTISGIFEAPGTVLESEIWMDRNDLMTLTQRDSLSCVVVRLEEKSGFGLVDLFTRQRLDLELTAIRESVYYEQISGFYKPIRAMAWMTAGLIGLGAVFGGFNMLYAAFATRIAEVATLQVIGYSRGAIFVSILQESLLATCSGTLLASMLAVLVLEGQAVNFSVGTFYLRLDLEVVTISLSTGVLLGVLGAIPPALRCLKAPLPKALRS